MNLENFVAISFSCCVLLVSIVMIFALTSLPFLVYQEYQKRDAEIEYIKRSKHSFDIEINRG